MASFPKSFPAVSWHSSFLDLLYGVLGLCSCGGGHLDTVFTSFSFLLKI
jgi:hypothetical protein